VAGCWRPATSTCLALEADLQRGIDEGQFELRYQPILEPASCRSRLKIDKSFAKPLEAGEVEELLEAGGVVSEPARGAGARSPR
jgi:sensor c-di-GMP phosphodiesterase-like protein